MWKSSKCFNRSTRTIYVNCESALQLTRTHTVNEDIRCIASAADGSTCVPIATTDLYSLTVQHGDSRSYLFTLRQLRGKNKDKLRGDSSCAGFSCSREETGSSQQTVSSSCDVVSTWALPGWMQPTRCVCVWVCFRVGTDPSAQGGVVALLQLQVSG